MNKSPIIVPMPMQDRTPQPGDLVRNKSSAEQFFDLHMANLKTLAAARLTETAHYKLTRLHSLGAELNPDRDSGLEAEFAELRTLFLLSVGQAARSITSETKLKAD
jgi:hypothetical protein